MICGITLKLSIYIYALSMEAKDYIYISADMSDWKKMLDEQYMTKD